LVFKRDDFDRPFVTHDPEFLELLVPHLDADLRKLSEQSIREQVKAIVKRLLSSRCPAIEDLASELNISVRSLQRRLANDGASFQQLLDEARRELAHEYLLNPYLELTEAAYLLGFEDSNSFFRAFHRWEGISPTKWRTSMQHQSGPA
jgi:AraC-like DNA-binding protein